MLDQQDQVDSLEGGMEDHVEIMQDKNGANTAKGRIGL